MTHGRNFPPGRSPGNSEFFPKIIQKCQISGETKLKTEKYFFGFFRKTWSGTPGVPPGGPPRFCSFALNLLLFVTFDQPTPGGNFGRFWQIRFFANFKKTAKCRLSGHLNEIYEKIENCEKCNFDHFWPDVTKNFGYAEKPKKSKVVLFGPLRGRKPKTRKKINLHFPL